MGTSSVYPPPYNTNSIVGIVWSTAAQRTTWFGSAVYYVHGIQAIPTTPALELLLREEWIAEEVPIYQQACDAAPDCSISGWNIMLFLNQAILDVKVAWARIMALPESVCFLLFVI